MTVAHRPAVVADRSFVIDNWLSSFRCANAAGIISTESWFDVMWPQIERLLDREGTTTLIAYERDDVDFFYGFVCGELTGPTPVVHYVYVKEPYRREGFARGLLAALGVDPALPFLYTCQTAVVARLRAKIPCARWRPQIARYSQTQERHHGK